MNGIRVHYTNIPDDIGSVFALIFEPILERLGKYHWAFKYNDTCPLGSGFFLPENLGNFYELAETLQPMCRPGEFLPKYSKFVSNDWNGFVGFSKMPADDFLERYWRAVDRDRTRLEKPDRPGPEAYMEERRRALWRLRNEGSATQSLIESEVEIYFTNWDFVCWELFAKDHALVEEVRRHVEGISGLRAEPAEIIETII